MEPIELLRKKDTFGLGFQPTAKDKKDMQAHKKVKKKGKQIVMSIPPLRYAFLHPSKIILSELDEENTDVIPRSRQPIHQWFRQRKT